MNKLKRLLLPPLFKLFKKSTFFSSLNQNTCPVLDAEEIKKQEQKEAIEKLYPKQKRGKAAHDFEKVENSGQMLPKFSGQTTQNQAKK